MATVEGFRNGSHAEKCPGSCEDTEWLSQLSIQVAPTTSGADGLIPEFKKIQSQTVQSTQISGTHGFCINNYSWGVYA